MNGSTAEDRILAALKVNPEGLTAVRLHEPDCGGLDYRKAITRLRRRGYVIVAHPIEGKRYGNFVLHGRISSEEEKR